MKNPYKPGAGFAPEYLAGRDQLLDTATNNLNELKEGGMVMHTVFYGVRGVGKTVLLNRVEEMADNLGFLYSHIECNENFDFNKNIIIQSKKFINQLSLIKSVKELIDKVKLVVTSFKTTYSPDDNTWSFGWSQQPYNVETADTGDFTTDLITLFTSLGKLAQKANVPICFFIDEIQALDKKYLVALITAIHRMNQLGLPILLYAAGLPTILRIAGDAKSYSERLFNFTKISSLNDNDAIDAITVPALQYGVKFDDAAVSLILKHTGGYPYFIQQYGRIIWNLAAIDRHVTKEIVHTSYDEYTETLDNSFYGVRFNRSTKAEKDFLLAMSQCKHFPCAMNEVSKKMNRDSHSISPLRNNLINKGLIYSPSFGEIDFTVPHFDRFLERTFLK
ncbi:ATP-binding protein [Congzhengia minquanensis]|uniref:ATP-binding protein n=1 Tax=Congzhengia minquanensis TaxID=2763657 RepID=A0A926DPA8_9FIRM|nr:ATP-binding protein [Congzhengia minquanensis]MBC8540854.1 ATP-binding protein [Congzhengia minquanensis]